MITEQKTLNLLSEEGDIENISLDLQGNFAAFFFEVFAQAILKVEGEFLYGDHLALWAEKLQANPRTCFVAPRFHLKSTIVLGYLAWKIYRMDKEFNEWLYLGYRQELAGYQIKRLKRYMRAIPEFKELTHLTNADSIIHVKNKQGREFIIEPEGIFSANRGRHPDGMIADDILKDPQVKLDIRQLEKIQELYLEEFEHMAKEEIHVVGTRQDENDLFAYIKGMDKYYYREWVAVENFETGKVLWPEKYPYVELLRIKKNIGDKAFNKEFQCKPVRSEDCYFTQEEIDAVVYNRLPNRSVYKEVRLNEFTFGGLDIGKKRHPSHLSVYGKNRKGKFVQLASIWLDHVDYVEQLEICREAIKSFRIQRLYYDDTRAEFEGFKEVGNLPPEMKGLSFTNKLKFQIAAELEEQVRNKTILMLPDGRQKRQILNVDNDLKSMETSEGHGDSFWSNAMAVHAAQPNMARITIL